MEPDGSVALVLVLEDEYDRERLEKMDIPSLTAPYTKVFTPGIWVSKFITVMRIDRSSNCDLSRSSIDPLVING